MVITETRGNRVFKLSHSENSTEWIPITLLPIEREILSLTSAIDPTTNQPIELLGYSLGRQFQRTDIPRSHGTIHVALGRLISWGLLRCRSEQIPGRTRRYYSITPAGIEKLNN